MTLSPPITVSRSAARRFMRAALLLDEPVADVAAAVAHHGYIQVDPINVCGRMHDLILRNRVRGYREGDLGRHLHGVPGAPLRPEQRHAFEHHVPGTAILVAFPLDAWPHLLAAMKARTRKSGAWSGRLTPRERAFAETLLGEVAKRGPLSSEMVDDGRRGRGVWGSATLAKSTLQKLFFHGRLLIARRENNRRYYDLPERVLPAEILAQPTPPAADTARWLAVLKLRQRRLVLLKRDEVPLVAERVQPVRVAGCAPLYCLREDRPLLDAAIAASAGEPDAEGASELDAENAGEESIGGAVEKKIGGVDAERARESVNATPREVVPVGPLRLLAPLDPLIYDRRVTRELWDFDYTWEAYTPPHKRVRGYYAMPLLAGLDLVGHIDAKADRLAGRLRVQGRSVRRGHAAAGAVRALAEFLGLKA